MWFEQEWHVWVGLLLGLGGLGVGIGAWIYAAKAGRKAGDVETAFRSFETDLERRLQAEATKRQTAPVTHDPANFVLRSQGSKYTLSNDGPGHAYGVQIMVHGGLVKMESGSRWREFRAGTREDLTLISDDSYDQECAAQVTWTEYADGPTLKAVMPVTVVPTPRRR